MLQREQVVSHMVDAVDRHTLRDNTTFVCLGVNTARALLDAIRAGDVPGIAAASLLDDIQHHLQVYGGPGSRDLIERIEREV